MLNLEIKWLPLDWLEFFVMGRTFYDGAYDVYRDDFSNNIKDEYRTSVTAEDNLHQILREAYFDLKLSET